MAGASPGPWALARRCAWPRSASARSMKLAWCLSRVAIEASIAAGINVNVTLLFSRAQVEATWAAYEAGLAARLADGQAIDYEAQASKK